MTLVSAAITARPHLMVVRRPFPRCPCRSLDVQAADDLVQPSRWRGLQGAQQDAVTGILDGEIRPRLPVMRLPHRLGQDDLAFG